MQTKQAKIKELLERGVDKVIVKSELEKLLRSGKKLRVYLGIDPTSTVIHLGNAVPLRKLRDFMELGHEVIFLVGSFTALIGDTSDKDSMRPALALDQIKANFKTGLGRRRIYKQSSIVLNSKQTLQICLNVLSEHQPNFNGFQILRHRHSNSVYDLKFLSTC